MTGGFLIVMTLGLASPKAIGRSQDLDSLISPGPLSRAHEELAGLRNCTSCHAPGKGIQDDKCLACHRDLSERMRAARGFHRGKTECAVCHPDHQGRDFALVQWDPSRFDHSQTGYDLIGLHRQVEACDRCHRLPNAVARKNSLSYLLTDTTCTGCHEDVHRGQLGKDCERCHSLAVPFKDVGFDHSKTAFPLTGAHRRVDCQECHVGGKWKGLPFSKCTDCHRDPHRPTLGADCARCHGETSWNVARFDHSRTRYPLLGKHAPLACGQCHLEEGKFRDIAFEECRDCHRQDPHFGQFKSDCASCHVVESFGQVKFDHSQSRYPLTGEHVSLACGKCHRKEQESSFPAGMATAVRYRPMETSCRSCHEDVHLGQLASDCERCHVTDGFRAEHVRFAHDRDTRYPLSGRHRDLVCERCHKLERATFPGGTGLAVRYKPISDFCVACHDNVHEEAWWQGRPGIPATDCERCHTEETFALTAFDHGGTAFPLEGAHRTLTCDRCHDYAVAKGHRFLLFQTGSRDCQGCHRTPHLKGMEKCRQCHTQSSWKVGF